MTDDFKKLDELKERLIKARESITMGDIEISDGELIKYNKHGQWTLNKEAPPYWDRKAQIKHRQRQQPVERRAAAGIKETPLDVEPRPVNVANVKPSVDTKYVNIPGKGRGEVKTFDKQEGAGSLHGSYTMTTL
jgi:hypothetical protein